jgi:hypothetical protein
MRCSDLFETLLNSKRVQALIQLLALVLALDITLRSISNPSRTQPASRAQPACRSAIAAATAQLACPYQALSVVAKAKLHSTMAM